MLTRIHHTGITVHNLDLMVKFYTQNLGLRVLREIEMEAPSSGDHTGIPGAHRKLVFLGLDDTHEIELVHYVSPPASEGHLDRHQLGSMHVGFLVDDLRELHSRLSAQGVHFATEPKFKEEDGATVGVIYARDPEGNWLEFIERN